MPNDLEKQLERALERQLCRDHLRRLFLRHVTPVNALDHPPDGAVIDPVLSHQIGDPGCGAADSPNLIRRQFGAGVSLARQDDALPAFAD